MSKKYPILREIKNKKFIYIWANNKKVTDQVVIDRINKLRIPPAYIDVKIFSPSSKKQYTALDSKGRIQKGYHENWIKERNRKKFYDLINFIKLYPNLIKKVNTLLKKKITTKEQVIALAISLLDTCRIRPGSEKHLKNTGSYGTTTLCKKHIKKEKKNNKNVLHIKFNGKSGIVNECYIDSNSNLYNHLYKLVNSTNKNNSYIFEYKNIKITPLDLNKFIDKNSNVHLTSKIFRTYHSNISFIQKLLDSLNLKTKSERKKEAVKIIKEVAKEHHHNPSTSRESYLFIPIRDLYINNINSFIKHFKKKDLNKALVLFISKNIKSNSNIPNNWK